MKLGNAIHNLAKLYEQNGLFRVPLSHLNFKLQRLICPEKNILTVKETSKPVSEARFSCQEITHLPFTNFTTSFLLKYKIKKGEYVPVNPTASPSKMRYIQNALSTALLTIDFLGEESNDSNFHLNDRICSIYQYVQERPKNSASLILGKEKEILILRDSNSLTQAIPVRYEKLKEGEYAIRAYNHKKAHATLVTSFYDTSTLTHSNKKLPVIYFD